MTLLWRRSTILAMVLLNVIAHATAYEEDVHRLRHYKHFRRMLQAQRSQRSLSYRTYSSPLGGHHHLPPSGRRRPHARKLPCQEIDVARKAYLADVVVLAHAESMSTNRVRNYSVTFRVRKQFKGGLAQQRGGRGGGFEKVLRLSFLNQTRRMNCNAGGTRNNNLPGGLVRAQIQQSREYYLFLNRTGSHNYSLVGMPVRKDINAAGGGTRERGQRGGGRRIGNPVEEEILKVVGSKGRRFGEYRNYQAFSLRFWRYDGSSDGVPSTKLE